jgi:hypothetical protein
MVNGINIPNLEQDFPETHPDDHDIRKEFEDAEKEENLWNLKSDQKY